jgi:hypothetical protein
MGELSETRASLRFFGDDLDPDEITRLLGKRPSVAERKGDVIRRKPPLPNRIVQRGSWRLAVTDAFPGNLDAQIAELLAGATPDLDIWRQLAAAYHGDVFCGLFLKTYNEGLSLSPLTLASLGDRGLVLDLDIYERKLDE